MEYGEISDEKSWLSENKVMVVSLSLGGLLLIGLVVGL